MISIGEFSKITKLTIKALRLYHEQGILIPEKIDNLTGYRYYDEGSFERAKIIIALKDLDFSLDEIKTALSKCNEDYDLKDFLKKKFSELNEKIDNYKNIQDKLYLILKSEKEIEMKNNFQVTEKEANYIYITSIRFKGKYSEVGSYFSKLFKIAGRYFKGKVFSLYYDDDYKENDADIEACIETRKIVDSKDAGSRILKGGKAVSIFYKGSYESLGEAYKRIFQYCNDKKFDIIQPTREIYLKGPGFIFKRNPRNYLTEIQFLIK
jgi:DNA-binding transcriptional MerR regulator